MRHREHFRIKCVAIQIRHSEATPKNLIDEIFHFVQDDNMKILGLTGAIASGKTTTAAMFVAFGVPVFNADEAVHSAYELADVQKQIHAIAPDVMGDEVFDRSKLRELVLKNPSILPDLERILHEAVAARRNEFIENARQLSAKLCVLDVPLLFETGLHKKCDSVACCHAPLDMLVARAKARPNYDEKLWQILHARHWSQAQKLAHSQYQIDTSAGLEFAKSQVQGVVETMS